MPKYNEIILSKKESKENSKKSNESAWREVTMHNLEKEDTVDKTTRIKIKVNENNSPYSYLELLKHSIMLSDPNYSIQQKDLDISAIEITSPEEIQELTAILELPNFTLNELISTVKVETIEMMDEFHKFIKNCENKNYKICINLTIKNISFGNTIVTDEEDIELKNLKYILESNAIIKLTITECFFANEYDLKSVLEKIANSSTNFLELTKNAYLKDDYDSDSEDESEIQKSNYLTIIEHTLLKNNSKIQFLKLDNPELLGFEIKINDIDKLISKHLSKYENKHTPQQQNNLEQNFLNSLFQNIQKILQQYIDLVEFIIQKESFLKKIAIKCSLLYISEPTIQKIALFQNKQNLLLEDINNIVSKLYNTLKFFEFNEFGIVYLNKKQPSYLKEQKQEQYIFIFGLYLACFKQANNVNTFPKDIIGVILQYLIVDIQSNLKQIHIMQINHVLKVVNLFHDHMQKEQSIKNNTSIENNSTNKKPRLK